MTQSPSDNTIQQWPKPAGINKVITFSINRNILLTLILSILLHLSLLWIFAPKLFSMGAPVASAPPLEISLGPPQKQEAAPSEAAIPTPEVVEKAPAEPKKAKPAKARPPKQVKPIAVPVDIAKTSEIKVQKQEKLNKKIPKPEVPTIPSKPLPGEDMQAYVKRVQQAKLAKKGLSKQDVEAVMASNNPQSEGEKRDAKIKANLDLDGTNGIFQVRYLGAHKATFSFKRWKSNVNTARLEIFNVSAPDGVDIRRVVIRKVIALIRRDYKDDFPWDSRRQNRVITLSARLQDAAELESFFMDEFFGPGTQHYSF